MGTLGCCRLLNSLVDTSVTSSVSDLITNQILTPSFTGDEVGSITTRFSTEDAVPDANKNTGNVLSVALVDSDQGSLEIEKSCFEEVGASCTVYTGGTEFCRDYKEHKFDLVIIDIQLKDNTGLSVLKFLKQKMFSPPVIVYSASLQKADIVKALGAGAKSYLTKPQKPSVLVQKSLALLQTR